ncbi:MAG TPA: host attachment protein [Caldimonas sp.]|jgi:protein required for attachment to host cells|nr:host attachment protein [Caldimonas sp.]
MSEDATSRSDADRAGDVRGPATHDEAGSGPTADAANARIDDGRWAERGVVPRTDNRTVWVLVADEALARILRWPDDGDVLEDVEAIADPAAHVKEGEFDRDSAGRRAAGGRATASITASAGEEERHLEAQSFARRVAAHLADALRQKRFDELRIVAAPRFLGHLRKELAANVRATVSDELSKDLIHEGNATLSRRLFGRGGGNGDNARR